YFYFVLSFWLLLQIMKKKIALSTEKFKWTGGNFPQMENIAAFKPVSTSPARSTCGIPERSSFCQSPSSQTELMNCYQAFCVQDCPYRSSTPPYAPLLLPAHCLTYFQIHDRRVSLFLDGLEEDGTPFDTQPLASRLSDISEDGAMWVGLSSNGKDCCMIIFVYMLAVKEIVEVYLGVLPELHAQSECRCPPSHPRVHPLVERYCIPSSVEDTTNDRVSRLNLNAHPLSYINDQDMGTTWLSKIMSTQELDRGVTITVDFVNGQYQVTIQFGGLLPDSQPWVDWQFMARNCSVFEMKNNGRLLRPDSVNCLQLPRDVPYSGGNITFSLLTPEPNLRPGYNDFYNTPDLQKMVHATKVRMHLRGQYHTKASRVNQRHRYYVINEITISGRCECHGHADHCDTSVTPYRCVCLPESHTEGNNCQRCTPLFNDKPFRSGDQLQPMNCRACQCHGHSLSCHYDVRADDQPDEHYRGGGGVCDNCMHNTMGKNCELCISGFFRLEESDPTSVDVCRPCHCHTTGTVNGSMECDQVSGQCQCKPAVTGRRCAECLTGWYGLKASNPNGCERCNCSDIGIISTSAGGDPSCKQDTGQCQCKPHVTGVSCDRCEFGYWNLSHPDGCIPCDCDPLGSLSSFCEPDAGQCECKPGVGGRRCNSCGRGSYGLRLEGSCAPCNCSQAGTAPGTDCDPYTGQCVCKASEHVLGHSCDSCRQGFHTLEKRNSLGCLPCACDTSGTVPEGVCDMWTGQCPCREGVEGAMCTDCAHNYYNKGLYEGCVPCICDPRGTVAGSVCDSNTGQCVCLPTRSGQDCSGCPHSSPYTSTYIDITHGMCVECDCHPMGALQRGCEGQTGQCVCAHPSVGGRRCDQCREFFFGFNPGLGRCQPCECDPSGSVNGSCHPDSGLCICKLLVTGDKCDLCQPEASHFDPENPFGCSKAPTQQPAPVGFSLSYSSLHLFWYPPDSPNSNKLNYTLMRDGQSVFSTQSPESFEDTGLLPYSNYSYWILTANVAGSTISALASYQTLGAPPEAQQLHLNLVGRPGPTTANSETILYACTHIDSHTHIADVSELNVTITDLIPNTNYSITLLGCGVSEGLYVRTLETTPEGLPPPTIKAAGPNVLEIQWSPPKKSNGLITSYHIYSFSHLFVKSSPQYDDTLSYTVTGLRPWTQYEFSVRTHNPAGHTNSPWVTVTTRQAPPRGLASPTVSHLAGQPSELLVSWTPPLEPNGFLQSYRIQRNNVSFSFSFDPTVLSYTDEDLSPFSTYSYSIIACTSEGCITSPYTNFTTLEAPPATVDAPTLDSITSSSINISWSQPLTQNGEVTEYVLKLNNQEAYRGRGRNTVLSDLQPHTSYQLVLSACTRGGCTTSSTMSAVTEEAPPTGLLTPTLKVCLFI
uniref:Usher syndrome 2A (autosomal recessive, mild) n=1 Tax=Labrus bergylta TaxID=56723 RepID=A0A3Q3EF52_9LABR